MPLARFAAPARLPLAGWIVACALSLGACTEEAPREQAPVPLVLFVSLPENPGLALTHAAEDLEAASRAISGGEGSASHTVRVVLEPLAGEGATGEQGYRLRTLDAKTLEVRAPNAVAASYGLYQVAQDLGARYIHPEQTVYPPNPAVTLPHYADEAEAPDFALRGFHEHTQHPIEMSDFLLRPDEPGHREAVSRYLRWMQRNRQNVLYFHMLNTVDLEAWVPYMQSITAEAKALGIHMGLVAGFVDQQQNAFRILQPEDTRAPEAQIRARLDQLLSSGIDFIGFQIGTSEFTKPDEGEVLAWLNLAVAHVYDAHPGVTPWAWIHITCGLERDNGKPFYHLPLEADARLGAFVHTTMFYTLDHPAPVYDCEDFGHQKEFMAEASGKRPMVFFPESAWWLGFDNNVPLVLPITGRSREHDIQEAIAPYDVMGHVTFTTGREWTYWQYDHYLTRVSWDRQFTWEAYQDWMAPAYGERGQALAEMVRAWTDAQWADFYEDNPLSYFYLAGELPQDEIGERAGILARRPKLAYRRVLEMEEEAFAQWQARDLEGLRGMQGRYGEIFGRYEAGVAGLSAPAETAHEAALVEEVEAAYRLYLLRIEHALALYEGVVAIRQGDRPTAEQHLARAQVTGEQAMEIIRAVEPLYRYAPELLTALKPESPTAYRFGYLHETHTGYFWIRREEQLAQLITEIFDAVPQEWPSEPAAVWAASGREVTLTEPQSPLLQRALGGFTPQLLIAALAAPQAGEGEGSWSAPVAVGQDEDLNELPDGNSLAEAEAEVLSTARWQMLLDGYPLHVRDASGQPVGDLTLWEGTWAMVWQVQAPEPVGEGAYAFAEAGTLEVDAMIESAEVVRVITSFAGIEPAALEQLIKSVWKLDAQEPLPARLPLKAQFPLRRLEAPLP